MAYWKEDDRPTPCRRCGTGVPASSPLPNGLCGTCYRLIEEAHLEQHPPVRRSHNPKCLSLPLPGREPGECDCRGEK